MFSFRLVDNSERVEMSVSKPSSINSAARISPLTNPIGEGTRRPGQWDHGERVSRDMWANHHIQYDNGGMCIETFLDTLIKEMIAQVDYLKKSKCEIVIKSVLS